MILVWIMVLAHCGWGQSQDLLGSPSISSIYSNSSSEVTRGQEVKDPKPCCSTGTFYTTQYFPGIMNTELGQQIKMDYKLIYCVWATVLGPVLNQEDATSFCQCDCEHAHGASNYDLDCEREYPCRCPYSAEDEIKFQSCKRNEANPAIVQPHPILENSAPPAPKYSDVGFGAEGRNKSDGGKSEICEQLIGQFGVHLICDAIVLPNGDAFYTLVDDDDGTKTKIFPDDICAIDCYVIHGVRVEPYGSCCDAEDGKQYCRCVK